MLRRMNLVRSDVSKEFRASFIRVTRTGELGTTLALTSNRRTLREIQSEKGSVSMEFHISSMLVTAGVVLSSPILVTLMK
jgi:hypothetical protein